MDFKEQSKTYRQEVEQAIDRYLPPQGARPARLHEAMRYSMEAGGKRLRPVFCLAASDLHGRKNDPLPAAVAIECLHTYSLIHDDLPCMDDGQLRRGRPTCHRKYDEWTAVLAGDALLTFAFELISTEYASVPALANDLVAELAGAAGSRRLLAGQVEDILGENAVCTAEQLDFIHLNKTAALLSASLSMGARTGGGSPETIETCREIGRKAGIAFQIVDDILDATVQEELLGKTAGGDEKRGKATYPKIHGIEESRRNARVRTREAVELCRRLPGEGAYLAALIGELEHRLN